VLYPVLSRCVRLCAAAWRAGGMLSSVNTGGLAEGLVGTLGRLLGATAAPPRLSLSASLTQTRGAAPPAEPKATPPAAGDNIFRLYRKDGET
jgi:hypothetical protein